MRLVQRVLQNLEERRQKVLNGGINCIPSPLRGLLGGFPGVEQAKYYLVSGASKSAKTRLTNFLFLYTPIMYAYYHPEQVRVKIFYFPLEETPEEIVTRFMCYLLYVFSDMKIRISPLDLSSTNADRVVDKKILEILDSIEYRSILDFFEDHVHFIQERNPTAVWKTLNNYAMEAGTIHRKTIVIENKETGIRQEKEVFDYYEPKDPDEYVEIIIDHISLVEVERGMTKKEAMDKLSEYCTILRNKYHYIPVVVQQQNIESIGLDAVKLNRIRPTKSGLLDTKRTGDDTSLMFGITNPFSFDRPEYLKYDITRLKGYARFLEIVLNRTGSANDLLALYFDGATNYFTPLPSANNLEALQKVYDLVQRNERSNPN